ncbi:DUF3617 domain-containing protein [Myxococcota bacterium]|nr:DUF3617 domain-containing protein [Myxococcota bacterium]
MRTIAVALILLSAATASAAEPGDLWQVETSMEMAGMKMPSQSQQVCTPLKSEGPEALSGEDDRCTMSIVRRSGNKFSWEVACPDGSGSGEMIYQGRDAYTSTMTMTAEGRTMKMMTRGKRIGDCDASQIKKQVAAAQAQGSQGMEQMCSAMVDALLPANLQTYQCKPEYKTQLCSKFQTKAGFAEVASRQAAGQAALGAGSLPEVSRFCGVDGEAMRTKLCGEASRSEDLAFLGKSCPDEAKRIAQRECAGRSFTSPAAVRYRDFCSEFARARMQGDSGDAAGLRGVTGPAESGAPESETPGTNVPGRAVEEGAKKLKGLLGF